jgi:hypothetical protein
MSDAELDSKGRELAAYGAPFVDADGLIAAGARPSLTPRALARSRPSLVPARISSFSNSARPSKTVSIKRPCGVVVSVQVGERTKTGFLLGNRGERVQQVAGGSRQPVEPRHHHHVAGGELVEHSQKFAPIGARAGHLLAVNLDQLAVSRYNVCRTEGHRGHTRSIQT